MSNMTGIFPPSMLKQPQPTEQQPVQQRQQPHPAGYYSNQVITRRNGGVQPQFINDIGGCSANYR
jgi:hypothetical protein